MNTGLRHIAIRRRLKKHLEPIPSRTPWKRILDRVMLIAAIAAPTLLLPQVFQIFETQDASSLSLFTWVSLTLYNALWLVYGLVHKELPIIVANVFFTLLNFAVVAGILLYG